MDRGRTNTVGTQGEKAKGLQIINIICDTRYLRHPRLSDGSRGGVRIVEGTQEGTQTFPPPYLAGYSEFERTRRLDGSAGITRSAIDATTAARPTGGL
jgi:hypothetical protein